MSQVALIITCKNAYREIESDRYCIC